MRQIHNIPQGGFDIVSLERTMEVPIIRKRFNPRDVLRNDRYIREKHLLTTLAPMELAPRLLAHNDDTLELDMEYIPQKESSLEATLIATMKAAYRLHNVCVDGFPAQFSTSSYIRSAGRMTAITTAIAQAELPEITRESMHPAFDALIKFVTDAKFDCHETHLLHGDLHPGNTLLDDTRTVFVDMGRSRYGDVAFDIGYCAYRTASGMFGTFSAEEAALTLRKMLDAYPKCDRSIRERSSMYYQFMLGADLSWITKTSREMTTVDAAECARATAENLQRIVDAYKKGFEMEV